ncbi:SEC12-like protein 2 [Punica granatum]|uniref:Anaphase-promoting complex subunit 4-like WD40 domain-containing protein n=2 Tax=Punica granatum TaxID=22663 RepID=A0A218XNG4_PUNGR|nr:SEC12-like protein 2 [Punica granatum]OWM86209.1 hypothetical protein CDL15_Pgr011033 [Punica granatum]PKI33466.1 hypothetical protein CRG98_046143 [Punica granatum]
MGKSKIAPDAPNSQKYGVPLYGAAWVPYKHIKSKEEEGDGKEEDDRKDQPEASGNYVVLAGGGGEGRSGIPNAVLLANFDFASNSLSPEPVAKHVTGSDLPYRLAVHPRGDGLICAMPKDCRFFEWDEVDATEKHKLGLKPSEKVLNQLEDVGQQLALVFNKDGSALATGGEDGKLRIFKWPSMDITFEEGEAHSSVKDLDFSHDGKLLVSLGNSGPCRVRDVTSKTTVASLSKEKDERFGFCRFSQLNEGTQVLYITAVTGRGSSILTWNTSSWKRTGSKHITRDSINAFNISADGKLLAVGTGEGDILILDSTSMRVRTSVKKAHLGFVTALSFSHDSRAVISVSMDSSARVTQVEDEKASGGFSLWLIILIVLLAIAVYFMKNRGLLLH